MDDSKTPALLPACGCFLGAWLAPQLTWLPLIPVIALLGLALALPGPAGRLLAACALGLFSAGVRSPPPAALELWLKPQRPVEVTGRASGHPSLQDDHQRVRLRAETFRQGAGILSHRSDVWLSLPGDAPAVPLGSRWRLTGYLRRSATYANHPDLARPPATWRLRVKSARFAVLESPPGWLARAGARLRSRVERRLDAAGPRGSSPALVRALVLGDTSRLPDPWRQALRRSGLGHLLAISGLHVGLLALWILLLAAPLPARARLVLGGLGVLLYLLLVGPRPAILRASAMAFLAAASLLWERPPQTWNALAAGVFLLVLWEPALAGDLGFQLSVAATAAVVATATAFPGSALRWRGKIFRALSISLAAQLATLPLILPMTGAIHPGAALLNLLAVPWLAAFLVAAFGWVAAGALSPSLGELLLPFLEIGASALDGLAALPPSAFFLLAVGPMLGLPWLLLIAFFAGPRWPRTTAGVAVALAALGMTGAGPSRPAGPVELTFVDVGQGDAILLRDGPHAVLIDGGGWPEGDLGGRVLLPALAAEGVRHLEALALTHPDSDHCGGLVDVARYLRTAELWMAPGWAADPCAREFLASPGPRWRPQWRGRRARVGRWRLDVLHPGGGSARGRNDRSLVIRAEVFGRRALLTGDVEAATERELVRRSADLRADVLKVAHHGSKTSTTESFLAAVRPEIAVVSAGSRNPYGHPHPAILERLAARRVRLLRTDRSGMIRLRFDPSGRIAVDLPAAAVETGGRT